MDLVYADEQKEDIGVLHDYIMDLAFGRDENDFECKVSRANHCCNEDYFLYFENTEYGGMVDDIGVNTSADEVTYYGRTWHGILNSKILEPDQGEDYLIVSGESNTVIGALVERMGLNSLFVASIEDSGIYISSYQMHRYVKGYDGIRKMLRSSGGKLNMEFKDGFVELSARPFVDYSKDEQFDSDQISFRIRKKGNCLNHVICLGKGNLAEREVIHVFADQNGNICEEQVLTGLLEVAETYENPNAESSVELKQGGIDMILASWGSNELEYGFGTDDESYDIGDVVGAIEYTTNTEVAAEISKKIVTIQNNTTLISYEVGE